MEDKRQVKINILTGFLGSGKTTLVTKILKNKEIKSKILFIQNELSEEMGIEKDVLTDSDGNELGNLIEMPNGCLCCVVKDNLVIFLEKALEKFKEISIIVVEAHGLTDVSQLVQKMWLDQELQSPLILNSIICMIDSYHFYKNYQENEEILKKQIICSDKIILNKIDLLQNASECVSVLDSIRQIITATNPLAKVLDTTFAEIDLDTFLEGLDLNNRNRQQTNEGTLQISNKVSISGDCTGCSDKTHPHHNSHIHFTEKYHIDNILIKGISEDLTKDKIDKAIGELLWSEAELHDFTIIRLKGVVFKKDRIFHIQGIYDIYEINELAVPDTYNYEIKVRESKILFIGRNLQLNLPIFNKKFS